MRLIEAIYPEKFNDAVKKAVEKADPDHWRVTTCDENDKRVLRAFFAESGAQGLVDDLQEACDGDKDWRIIVIPVEATAPPIEDDEEEEKEKKQRDRTALREEIYDDVVDGAALDIDFFLLTVASTIVAAIGLNSDNVAAVIGAMVIAPLLGPILAVTFGATLGDFKLIVRAARNAVFGLAVGVSAAVVMGYFLDVNFESEELMSRIVVGLDSIALALAAGVAAALSIVAGVSSALVGVMVAVALLPPAAAIGLFFGAGEFTFAARAGLLLTVNVVCIMLSAQAVYFWKGVRPRTWLEKKSADNAMRINLLVLVVLLAIAAAIIWFAPTEVIPDNPVRN